MGNHVTSLTITVFISELQLTLLQLVVHHHKISSAMINRQRWPCTVSKKAEKYNSETIVLYANQWRSMTIAYWSKGVWTTGKGKFGISRILRMRLQYILHDGRVHYVLTGVGRNLWICAGLCSRNGKRGKQPHWWWLRATQVVTQIYWHGNGNSWYCHYRTVSNRWYSAKAVLECTTNPTNGKNVPLKYTVPSDRTSGSYNDNSTRDYNMGHYLEQPYGSSGVCHFEEPQPRG